MVRRHRRGAVRADGRLADLFSEPKSGVRVLAKASWQRIRRTPCWWRVSRYRDDYRATVANYGNVALTVRGLAVRFQQEPGCDRSVATVPYATLSPHLSARGKRLVAAVWAHR